MVKAHRKENSLRKRRRFSAEGAGMTFLRVGESWAPRPWTLPPVEGGSLHSCVVSPDHPDYYSVRYRSN